MKKSFSDPLLSKMFEQKGNLCVSVIVPLYKISPERNQNPIRVSRAVEEVKVQLNGIRTKDKKQAELVKKILSSLSQLHSNVDFVRNGKGVGLFVSENFSHLVYFPFDVEEKIIISDSFEIRDMLYKEHYLAEYLVLVLTLNSAKLFIGKDGVHKEITNKDFPKNYTDEFLYNKPSPGNSYGQSLKNPEKDKSVIKIIRLKEFYRQVDAVLPQYFNEQIPIIISGVAKCLSSFLEVTIHQKKIISQITGNYSDIRKHDFEIKTWKKVLQHQRDSETALIKDLENKLKTRSVVIGLKNIWQAVEEGRGLLLVVEKDFRQTGFQKTDTIKINTKPLDFSDLKIRDDAVDDLIELVLEKNGTVSFVKNGALKKMQRVALLTRY